MCDHEWEHDVYVPRHRAEPFGRSGGDHAGDLRDLKMPGKTSQRFERLILLLWGYTMYIQSKAFFNQTFEIIGCPVFEKGEAGPLHMHIKAEDVEGYVHCEKMTLR